MKWLPACTKRQKGFIYVPESHYRYGYVNGGESYLYDWLMVDTVKSGLYCTLSNLYYRPGTGNRLFRLDINFLSDVYINKQTGFFMSKMDDNFVKFYPMSVSDLVPDIFLP